MVGIRGIGGGRRCAAGAGCRRWAEQRAAMAKVEEIKQDEGEAPPQPTEEELAQQAAMYWSLAKCVRPPAPPRVAPRDYEKALPRRWLARGRWLCATCRTLPSVYS